MQVIPLLEIDEPCLGMVQLRDGSMLRGTVIRDDFDVVVMRIEGCSRDSPARAWCRPSSTSRSRPSTRRLANRSNPTSTCGDSIWRAGSSTKAPTNSHRPSSARSSHGRNCPPRSAFCRSSTPKIELERGDIDGSSGDAGGGLESRTLPLHRQNLLPKEHLTAADVNLIRVYEIDFRNPPSQIFIEPEHIRELLEKYGASPLIPTDSIGRTQIFQADPIDIVDLMFKLKASDLYSTHRGQQNPPP